MDLLRLTAEYPDNPSGPQRWFETQRWGDAGPTCGHCGSTRHSVTRGSHKMPYRCRACRQYFSAKLGTVMESSKLGYRAWLIAIYLLSESSKGVSSVQLAKHLGISQKSAWHLGHRIRAAWASGTDPLMRGPVEVDEVYIGGRERNKHQSKRSGGRGPSGKQPIMGIVDRDTGEVDAAHVSDVTAMGAAEFIARRVEHGATVYSDDAAVYGPLARLGFGHDSVRHSAAEYVRGSVHTNSIESVWALFRRGYIGTYHVMSPKHLGRYVREFVGRHNARKRRTGIERVASQMTGVKLRWQDLTAPCWPDQLALPI